MGDGIHRLPKSRERSIQDLIQFVRNRTDSLANYTLLLGAGASVTSGIRSANALVEEWRREVYERSCSNPIKPYDPSIAKETLAREFSQWYSPQREYASLFEKKFDLPRQRRMFVEREVANKLPSLGYAYLIRLIQQNFFNTIFTTNFDDLLNEAFHLFSDIRPIVCAHDSSIASITVTSKRPKIVKLHGDYLFDDIKSTLRETESLEENMKKKFIEFSKDHGLIVVGYGACDRSIMDVMHRLLKQDDYFKNGIYWCVRSDVEPSEELSQLLWKDRVYWVRIDGFDELMAEIYAECLGAELPIDTSVVSEKPREILGRFCKDEYLRGSSSSRIRLDLGRFQRELDQEAMVQSLRDVTKDEGDPASTSGLSDREFIRLIAVKQLVELGEYKKARDRINSELSQATSLPFRSALLTHRLSNEQMSGDWDLAIETCEELLASDPRDAAALLSRAKCERTFQGKMQSIERAIALDPFLPSALRYRASLLERQIDNEPGCDHQKIATQICEDYSRSLQMNPATSNGAWLDFASFLMSEKCPVENSLARAQTLLDELARRDPFSLTYLSIAVEMQMSPKKSEEARTALLGEIRSGIESQPRYRRRSLELLLLRAQKRFFRHAELLASLKAFEGDPRWQKDAEFANLRASVLMEVEGKFHEALRLLQDHSRFGRDDDMIAASIHCLCILERTQEARKTFECHSSVLTKDRREQVFGEILEAEGNLEEFLLHLRRRKSHALFPASFAVQETHTLLKLARYPDAERIAKEILQPALFSHQFDALIINYEIAVQRQGRKVDKVRLDRIAEGHAENDPVKICARFLLDQRDSAAELLVNAVRRDRTSSAEFSKWAVFDTPSGRAWLTSLLKSKALAIEVGVGEGKRTASTS